MVKKGATPDDHITGALKATCAINEAKTHCLRIRTLEIFDGIPIDVMRQNEAFVQADDDTVVHEIRRRIREIRMETELLSASATNRFQVNGRLPEDRERLLPVVDEYLSMEPGFSQTCQLSQVVIIAYLRALKVRLIRRIPYPHKRPVCPAGLRNCQARCRTSQRFWHALPEY